jgi:hypothetical protein
MFPRGNPGEADMEPEDSMQAKLGALHRWGDDSSFFRALRYAARRPTAVRKLLPRASFGMTSQTSRSRCAGLLRPRRSSHALTLVFSPRRQRCFQHVLCVAPTALELILQPTTLPVSRALALGKHLVISHWQLAFVFQCEM